MSPTPTPIVLSPDTFFDYSGFAGFPVGTTLGEFEAGTGWISTECSAPGWVTWAPPGEDLPWVLWGPGIGDWSVIAEEDLTIDRFSLQTWTPDDGTGPFGPVGPEGIQLGFTESAVQAAFPEVTGVDYFDDFLETQYRYYIIEAPDGTGMLIALVDGRVTQITWGSEGTLEDHPGTWCP